MISRDEAIPVMVTYQVKNQAIILDEVQIKYQDQQLKDMRKKAVKPGHQLDQA